MLHTLRSMVVRKNAVAQKDIETSLIRRFLYPKFGPDKLWEEVGRRVLEQGGELLLQHQVVKVETAGARLTRIVAHDCRNDKGVVLEGDFFPPCRCVISLPG